MGNVKHPVLLLMLGSATLSASLWQYLPQPLYSKTLLTMEDLDQSYGYILCRTRIDAGGGGELVLSGLHDYAQVYIDQTLIGFLDRRTGTTHLTLPVMKAAATLVLLVENSGRVNYTSVIRGEHTGITGSVTLAGKEPKRWEIYSLPMDELSRLRFQPMPCEGPCFYRASMQVSTPADIYIDTEALHKGELWLDGRTLGRFWSVGPQFALYAPAPWLRQGTNDIVYFDLMGDHRDAVRTRDQPLFTMPRVTP